MNNYSHFKDIKNIINYEQPNENEIRCDIEQKIIKNIFLKQDYSNLKNE